ncbi:hypothetical protein [Kitasatospora sp. NBC_01266]|uniref:hypothetical protein n=1 Tax=Kitasatospora sp. NBC_01266 TaxID=2903572 RepID=UPI002E33E324|nr:hypothetical protein [Kitasatospora sp. NBC_01266]
MRITAIRAGAAGVLILLAAGAAAAPALAATPQHATAAAYSDADVTSLLAFGTGPIAQQHPTTLKQLGETPRSVDAKTVTDLTGALNKVDPNYHAVVAQGLQSHNPYKVRAALTQYTADVNTLANTSKGSAVNPDGSWFVWTSEAIVQTGTVATTVAAAAEVGVVAVVAYAHGGDESAFTQESIAAGLAGSL